MPETGLFFTVADRPVVRPDLLCRRWKWKKAFYSHSRCFSNVLSSSGGLKLHLWIMFEYLFLAFWLFKQICRWVNSSARVNSCWYFHSSWFWCAAETKTLGVWCDEFWMACYQLRLLCEQALCFRFSLFCVLSLDVTASENPALWAENVDIHGFKEIFNSILLPVFFNNN